MNPISNIKRITFLLLFILLNFGCDQVSKIIVRDQVAEHANISIIDNFLTLTKVENTGAFLSIGHNLPEVLRILILNLFPILVIGFGLYYLFTEKNLNLWTQAGFCMLLGGGLGNVYDRIVYGSVTDFLHMDFGFVQTGVFNVADMFIMAGIGILFIYTFKKDKKDKNLTIAP
ncbi:MAG: signal peptidase II [Pedobacter sp.]|nr:MAG: signal peptidase II [Pedobacter sp.]